MILQNVFCQRACEKRSQTSKTIMAKILYLSLCSFAYFSFPSSCAESQPGTLTDDANCFTLNMYKQMTKGKSNMVSSPFGVDVLLSMLLDGAGGKTAQELSKTLGYEGKSLADVNNAFTTQLDKLQSSQGNTLDLATSIWIQSGLNVNPNFKNAVRNYFRSGVYEKDFNTNPSGATQDINDWSNTRTHGLIPTLFDQDLGPNTVMVLANAMYFNGTWEKQFETDDTRDGDFMNNDSQNNPSKVKLMYQNTRFNYKLDNTLNSQVLEMFYKGRDMSMIILLPKAGFNLQNLEQSLDCTSFKAGISTLKSTTVDVTVPRFDFKSDYDLKDPLKAVGVEDIFKGSADLSGISPGIAVSTATQKCVVKVLETGTEAAVVTGMVLETMSGGGPVNDPVHFTANHPFVFLIQDKRTGLVLFMGRVVELPS